MKKASLTERQKSKLAKNTAALIVVGTMGDAAAEVDKVPVVGPVVSAPIKLVMWGIAKLLVDDSR